MRILTLGVYGYTEETFRQALTEANIELKLGNLAGYQAKVDQASSYIAEANRIIAEAADAIASGEPASFTSIR